MLLFLLLALALPPLTQCNDEWKFLKSYPLHLLVHQVKDGSIDIDGKIDDDAW